MGGVGRSGSHHASHPTHRHFHSLEPVLSVSFQRGAHAALNTNTLLRENSEAFTLQGMNLSKNGILNGDWGTLLSTYASQELFCAFVHLLLATSQDIVFKASFHS